MCTHQCCVLIEDIFIHLVMRFPGTETRIKKNQNKTCVHNCVVNPQRNLVKLNTQNGIGLNVFFLVGTICKHQNTQQFHHGWQILKFKKKKEVEFKWLPTCSVCDTSFTGSYSTIDCVVSYKGLLCTYNKFKYQCVLSPMIVSVCSEKNCMYIFCTSQQIYQYLVCSFQMYMHV